MTARDDPGGRAEAEAILLAALGGDDPESQANGLLVGLALHDEDQYWVEDWCVRIGRSAPDPYLRGVASVCIGHLARRFGAVGAEARALVHELARTPDVRAAYRGVDDAVADLEHFTSQ